MANIRTVASLGREQTFFDLYVNELEPHHKTSMKNSQYRALVMALARSIMFFAFAACMYYGGVLIRDEGLPIENVFK